MLLMQNLPIPTTSYNPHAKQSLNLQAITIWTSSLQFIIQPNYQKSGIPTSIYINRQTNEIIECQQKMPECQRDGFVQHYFSAFLGIFNINNKRVVVIVEEVQLVLNIGGRDVFKIVKPLYLFYKTEDKAKLTEEQSMLLINLTLILQGGMYFSFSYDLDVPLNSSDCEQNNSINFNWSSSLQSQLQSFSKSWRLPLIQGYCNHLQMILNGLKIFIFLISRRAISRSQTLYSQVGRGIDIIGNTSNYVETELILNVNDYFFSYLQARGSVPIFWIEQGTYVKINKQVKVINKPQQNFRAFQQHLRLIKLRNAVKHVGILNLLNQNNTAQSILIQNYQCLVQKRINCQLKKDQQGNNKQIKQQKELGCRLDYAYFNIHSQCSDKIYTPLTSFIKSSLCPLLHHYSFTLLLLNPILKTRRVLSIQTGLIRSNCYNCIDRSNIAQLSISAFMIQYMLKHLGIQVHQFNKHMGHDDNNFAELYRSIWADNADSLSKQYTGTGSTESFALRKGKLSYLTTIDHGMKSITRAINNIRNPDSIKNKAIQLLTGYTQPTHGTNKQRISAKQIIQKLQGQKRQIQVQIPNIRISQPQKDFNALVSNQSLQERLL